MSASFPLMIKLFILMAIGFAGNKIGIINETVKTQLSRVLVNIILPVGMIASSQQEFSLMQAKGVLWMIIISLLYYIVMMGIGIFLCKSGKISAIEVLLVTFANTAFLGIPIASEIAGSTGVLYAVIFNSIFDLIYFSLGMYLLKNSNRTTFSFRDIKEVVNNPMTWIAILTILLYLVPFRFPLVVTEAFDSLGNTMMPVSTLVIGAQIADMPIKRIFTDKRAYVLSMVRMVVIPALVLWLMKLLMVDREVAITVIVLSAMPSGSLNVIMAERYESDVELATTTVMQSTIFMLVTLPVIIYFVSANF